MHKSMERLHKVAGLIRKKDIAKALGVSPASITNWENRGMSEKAARKAAKIWGVDVNYLMDGFETSDSASQEESRLDIENRKMLNIISTVTLADKDDSSLNKSTLGRIEKPERLSDESFVLLVASDQLSAIFNKNDYLYIETRHEKENLRPGDYLLLINKLGEIAIRCIGPRIYGSKEILIMDNRKDESPTKIEKLSDYDFIGVIDSRLTMFM